MSIFEQASRLKLRFETRSGNLAAEDLWDLPLSPSMSSRPQGPNLDEIAIGLHGKLKTSAVSFVTEDEKPNALFQLQFDIVKHIIDVKKAERTAAADAKKRADDKQRIMALIARKQDEKLESKSEEELQKLLADL